MVRSSADRGRDNCGAGLHALERDRRAADCYVNDGRVAAGCDYSTVARAGDGYRLCGAGGADNVDACRACGRGSRRLCDRPRFRNGADVGPDACDDERIVPGVRSRIARDDVVRSFRQGFPSDDDRADGLRPDASFVCLRGAERDRGADDRRRIEPESFVQIFLRDFLRVFPVGVSDRKEVLVRERFRLLEVVE